MGYAGYIIPALISFAFSEEKVRRDIDNLSGCVFPEGVTSALKIKPPAPLSFVHGSCFFYFPAIYW